MKFLWIASIVGSLLVAGLLAALGVVFKENLKELTNQWGWNKFFVRWWQQWRHKLSWLHLRGLWWLWSIFGLIGGVALTLWLTPVLNPRSVKWMSILTAIDTFAPADLRRDFDESTKQLKDLAQQHTVDVFEVADVDAKRQKARDMIIGYLHDQLKNGTLLAKAYDQDKREEVVIPTDEWEYLQLRVEGAQFKQIGAAGGAGRHLTGVLLGKASQ
jgi:hypothetical protein